MTENISFSDALTEVRKAHRLLWAFYSRLIPACEQLMREFEPATFYSSEYFSLGNKGSNPLVRKSTHYMLPYMSMDILYGDRSNREDWFNNPQKGDYLLVLSLQLDTGFFKDDGTGRVDNPNVADETFPAPGATNTRILLTTLYCNKNCPQKNWRDSVYFGNWQYIPETIMQYNLDKSAVAGDPDFIAYGCELNIEKDLANLESIKHAATKIRQKIKQGIPAINWG